jgi:hypothetical protein
MMRVGQRASALVILAALAGSGCGKSDPAKAKDGAAEAGGVPAALLAAWQKANLQVSAFTVDKSGAVGAACHSGTVNGLDVLVCTFPTDGEAKAAEAKGLEWVGSATGTALVAGKRVLAVVDRRSADPSGRTINAVAKAFR